MAIDKEEARRQADKLLQDTAKKAPNYDKLHWLSMPAFYRTAKLKQLPIATQKPIIEQATTYINDETAFGYLKFLYMVNAFLGATFLVGSHRTSSIGAIGIKILIAITICLWVARLIKTRAYIDQVILPKYY